jgi:hypothetical protein
MNRFWSFQVAGGVSNNDLDVPPYLAHIRTFGLKLAGSEHSTGDFRHIMSAEFTKTM